MSVEPTLSRKRWLFLGLALMIFVVDQLTKNPFRSWPVGQTLRVFPWLSFTYVQNTGSLFGIFPGKSMALGFVSATISAAIIWYAWHLPRKSGWLSYLTLGVLLGGATGNMLDRLAFSFVVDFFDLQWNGHNIWPIFNVADIAVDLAIALFVLMAIIEPRSQLNDNQASEPAEKNP